MGKRQVVAAISQSRRMLYVAQCTRFGNRGYKAGIADQPSIMNRKGERKCPYADTGGSWSGLAFPYEPALNTFIAA
jgi:hypothetical protein